MQQRRKNRPHKVEYLNRRMRNCRSNLIGKQLRTNVHQLHHDAAAHNIAKQTQRHRNHRRKFTDNVHRQHRRNRLNERMEISLHTAVLELHDLDQQPRNKRQQQRHRQICRRRRKPEQRNDICRKNIGPKNADIRRNRIPVPLPHIVDACTVHCLDAHNDHRS